MRRFIIISILTGLMPVGMNAQTVISEVLYGIEKNNLTLKSAREEANIKKMDARIEGNLENPEVDFEYLFGNKATGYQNETAFAIKQGFDFPTVYYHRNKVVTAKDSLAMFTYLEERQNLLLEAKLICLELICLEKQEKLQTERYNHAVSLQKLYDRKFEEGASNQVDLNKIKLELLNSKAAFQFFKMAKESSLKKLEALNGNEPLDLSLLTYDDIVLPVDFVEYYSQAERVNAELRVLTQGREVSKREINLAKSKALPKFSLGYQTEIAGAERLRGVVASVSVPLWAHRNTVKKSKNQLVISDLALSNAKINFKNESLQLYQNAKYQKDLYDEYASINLSGNMELLTKSLDAGQISLLEYFNELIILFDSYKTVLELERDLQISYTQLMKFNL